MATPIVIPREGQSMETGNILEWLVSVGDTVEFGQALCEVESEKTTFTVESPVEGVVKEIIGKAGEEYPVLTPIAYIEED